MRSALPGLSGPGSLRIKSERHPAWVPLAALLLPAVPVSRSDRSIGERPVPKGTGRLYVFLCSFPGQARWFRAAVRMFSISMARVMGPTPPGTGVM